MLNSDNDTIIVIWKGSDKIHNSKSLELLGHTFIVDNVRYFIPIDKPKQKNHEK